MSGNKRVTHPENLQGRDRAEREKATTLQGY